MTVAGSWRTVSRSAGSMTAGVSEVSDDKAADAVVRHLARRFYDAYCDVNGRRPYRDGYVPAWALDYAEIAVDVLGFDDDTARRVSA